MHILLFLIQTLFFVLVATALVRGWMNTRQMRMNQQPGVFCIAVTDWFIKPLRRTLPQAWLYVNTDWASFLGALLLSLAYSTLLHVVWGGQAPGVNNLGWMITLPVLALVFLVRTLLQTLMIVALVYAVLSWFQPHSPLSATVSGLVEPVLKPIRRMIPTIGGVDLSVLVLIILIQVGLMITA